MRRGVGLEIVAAPLALPVIDKLLRSGIVLPPIVAGTATAALFAAPLALLLAPPPVVPPPVVTPPAVVAPPVVVPIVVEAAPVPVVPRTRAAMAVKPALEFVTLSAAPPVEASHVSGRLQRIGNPLTLDGYPDSGSRRPASCRDRP